MRIMLTLILLAIFPYTAHSYKDLKSADKKASKIFKVIRDRNMRFLKNSGETLYNVDLNDLSLGHYFRYYRVYSKFKSISDSESIYDILDTSNFQLLYPIWHKNKETIGYIRLVYYDNGWRDDEFSLGPASIQFGFIRRSFPIKKGFAPFIIEFIPPQKEHAFYLSVPKINKFNLTKIKKYDAFSDMMWFMQNKDKYKKLEKKNKLYYPKYRGQYKDLDSLNATYNKYRKKPFINKMLKSKEVDK